MSKRIRDFAMRLTLRKLLLLVAAAAPLTVAAILADFDPVAYAIFAACVVTGALYGAGVLPKRYFR